MANVLKFEKPPRLPARGCGTCVHNIGRHSKYTYIHWRCGVQAGVDCVEAWHHCSGKLWEATPPILVRLKRWLVG